MATVPLRACLALGLGLLGGCASGGGADFDRRMATYVSGPESQLVGGLGVPQRVYEANGRRFLEYDFTSTAGGGTSVTPSIGLGFGRGGWGHGVGVGTGIGFGFGGSSAPYEPCSVTFEIRDDRVLNFQRRGDSCA